MLDSGIIIIFAVLVAVIVLAVFLRFFPIGLWISALASGVHISIGTLVGMRVRRIQPQRLVYPLIKANKAGLDLTITKLETHLPCRRQCGPGHQCPDRRPARQHRDAL